MKLPNTLYHKIVNFLISLPNMDDNESQRAFIYQVGLDQQLETQISFGKPPAEFVPLLLAKLLKYGRLKDKRHPLEAVLETAKNYVGQDKSEHCDSLLHKLRPYLHQSPEQYQERQAFDQSDTQLLHQYLHFFENASFSQKHKTSSSHGADHTHQHNTSHKESSQKSSSSKKPNDSILFNITLWILFGSFFGIFFGIFFGVIVKVVTTYFGTLIIWQEGSKNSLWTIIGASMAIVLWIFNIGFENKILQPIKYFYGACVLLITGGILYLVSDETEAIISQEVDVFMFWIVIGILLWLSNIIIRVGHTKGLGENILWSGSLIILGTMFGMFFGIISREINLLLGVSLGALLGASIGLIINALSRMFSTKNF